MIKREHWKTRFGFLMAAIGSAIGLGNIWRFNYVCYTNGGGAFLIPYIIALFTAGIPLLILEFGLGQHMQGSAPQSFSKISKRWEWLGWWPIVFSMFGILLYYSVVISWALSYFVYSFGLKWGSNPNTYFFQDYLKISSGPWQIKGVVVPIVISLAAIWLINWIICYKGIHKGIEKACRIFMPVLFILAGVLVIRGVTLPGALSGINWYLKPSFSSLLKPEVWIAAYGQIFFSLSIAFGIMIAYASYLPRESDIVNNGFITGLANSGFSFFVGFAVFSTLGYMSFTTGAPFNQVVTQGLGLAFVTFPQAIGEIPLLPQLFGIIFFLCLIIAGLSSSISLLEAFAAALIDKMGIPRHKTITFLVIFGFLGGIIFTTRAGLFWLDIVDHYILSYALVLVGLLECVVIGWIFGSGRMREWINEFSDFKIGKWWEMSIKVIIPVILSVILVLNIIKELKGPYEDYPASALILIGFGWLVATLIGALILNYKSRRKRITNNQISKMTN